MDSPLRPDNGVLDIVTTSQLRDAANRVVSEGMMRARCMVVPVDPATAICRVLGRYKMYVDLRDRGFVPHLMFDGFWEYWITDFMWRNVAAGQVALDLGANHGYYTILLADLVGASGRVVAFEPNPRLGALLADTIAVNGFADCVTLQQVAVGEGPGTLPFLVPLRDPKNGRLVAPGEAAPDAEQHALHQVPVTTLDAAIPGAVDFVKIDVEGAEEGVWRGMQGLIARSPGIRIVLEFNPRRCRDPQSVLGEIGARFALREITFDGVAVPCTAEEVLGRTEDTILYLSALDPA
jgi:FkbM family methyltransferase